MTPYRPVADKNVTTKQKALARKLKYTFENSVESSSWTRLIDGIRYDFNTAGGRTKCTILAPPPPKPELEEPKEEPITRGIPPGLCIALLDEAQNPTTYSYLIYNRVSKRFEKQKLVDPSNDNSEIIYYNPYADVILNYIQNVTRSANKSHYSINSSGDFNVGGGLDGLLYGNIYAGPNAILTEAFNAQTGFRGIPVVPPYFYRPSNSGTNMTIVFIMYYDKQITVSSLVLPSYPTGVHQYEQVHADDIVLELTVPFDPAIVCPGELPIYNNYGFNPLLKGWTNEAGDAGTIGMSTRRELSEPFMPPGETYLQYYVDSKEVFTFTLTRGEDGVFDFQYSYQSQYATTVIAYNQSYSDDLQEDKPPADIQSYDNGYDVDCSHDGFHIIKYAKDYGTTSDQYELVTNNTHGHGAYDGYNTIGVFRQTDDSIAQWKATEYLDSTFNLHHYSVTSSFNKFKHDDVCINLRSCSGDSTGSSKHSQTETENSTTDVIADGYSKLQYHNKWTLSHTTDGELVPPRAYDFGPTTDGLVCAYPGDAEYVYKTVENNTSDKQAWFYTALIPYFNLALIEESVIDPQHIETRTTYYLDKGVRYLLSESRGGLSTLDYKPMVWTHTASEGLDGAVVQLSHYEQDYLSLVEIKYAYTEHGDRERLFFNGEEVGTDGNNKYNIPAWDNIHAVFVT